MSIIYNLYAQDINYCQTSSNKTNKTVVHNVNYQRDNYPQVTW